MLDIENYIETGKKLKKMGVNSICIKDMAGIMSPSDAYEIIKRLKQIVRIPIFLHCHSTTGIATATYIKAIEAGCDGIDTSISCFSGGASLPATESMNYILNDLGYNTELNSNELNIINNFFKKTKDNFIDKGILTAHIFETRTEVLTYQIPGGMLSNLITQLKEQNAEKILQEVLEEVPLVRKDLGYPPLVTPLSQIVGVQATINILLGERYKKVTKEVKSYLLGLYGEIPWVVNGEIKKKIFEENPNYTVPTFNRMKPVFEITKYKLEDNIISDEDVLTYILFPEYAEDFLKKREEKNTTRVSYFIEALKDNFILNSKLKNNDKSIIRKVNLISVNENDAALIIAIMCEHLSSSLEELTFKYIKLV